MMYKQEESVIQYLIIEDDPTTVKVLRHLVKQALGESSFQVVSSLRAAREFISLHREQLLGVIADIELPDAPNGEAIDEVLAHNIPCVVLTGRTDQATRQQLIEKGVSDYVTKGGRHWYFYAVDSLKRLIHNRNAPVLTVIKSSQCSERIQAMLKSQQFPILQASSESSALELLSRDRTISLLIVDHDLGESDGLSFIQTVRQQHSQRPLGILALSGQPHSREELTVEFIKSGADDFLPKPVNHEEFLCRIAKIATTTDALKQLQQQANQDYLTGLYNRRYFALEAQNTLDRFCGQESCLGMLDIDHFKKINDEYGHQAGDIVLKELARELKECFPQLLISRFGGEEFAILMPGLSKEIAQSLMDDFRIQIASQKIDVEDGDFLSITVCVGVCAATGLGIQGYVSVADECLYRAKIGGRNQVVTEAEVQHKQD